MHRATAASGGSTAAAGTNAQGSGATASGTATGSSSGSPAALAGWLAEAQAHADQVGPHAEAAHSGSWLELWALCRLLRINVTVFCASQAADSPQLQVVSLVANPQMLYGWALYHSVAAGWLGLLPVFRSL